MGFSLRGKGVVRYPRTKAQQRELDLEARAMMADPIPDSDKCEKCGGYLGSNPEVRLTRCVCKLRQGIAKDTTGRGGVEPRVRGECVLYCVDHGP